MKEFKALLTTVAMMAGSHAGAEVVLQESYKIPAAGNAPTQLDGGVGPFGYEIDVTAEFSAAGHDKLVLVFSGHDGAFNIPYPPEVTSVTYDGAALTQAIYDFDNGALVCAGIFYLDNVATDGLLRIELSAGNLAHYAFGLYAVDGTRPGVQDTGTARDPLSDATVTMTTNSGFFVQETARNNQSLAGDGSGDYSTLYSYSVDSYRVLSQYRVTTTPGDYLAPINNGGANYRRVVTAAFEAVEAPQVGPMITSFTSVGPNLWELELSGDADTAYEFRSSTTLDFDPGTLVENLTQGDPGDAGSIGGANDSVLTTDSNGDGKARLTLSGGPADFVRAQNVSPLLSEDFEAGDGGFTVENKATGTDWAYGEPNSPNAGGGALIGGNGGSTNAWGTNLTGVYGSDTDTCLRSPVIDLTGIPAAELSFALAIDAQAGHTYQVDVIDDLTDTVIANVIEATEDVDFNNAPWEIVGPLAIPAGALGQPVRIQWTFTGDGTFNYNGAYIDDVLVTQPAP
ncbi:hypothetical protein HAHE_07530 [Haloferula helveola]|uniref:Uncharacterized protein n=1 Tax=Haloferula helveola TaxID=490095 RepID=A0ABN6H030_9BACT|nr:hypothetical protein HAHE_07530 [Haloferula helveola]